MPNLNPQNSATRLKPGHTTGTATRWQKGGPSPNPSGKSKLQRQFEQALADALVGDDPEARAKELAEIAWGAGRAGEAWAVTLLFQRLAPQAIDVRMSRGRDEQDELDWSKLTTEEIKTIEAIFERQAITSGEGGSEPR